MEKKEKLLPMAGVALVTLGVVMAINAHLAHFYAPFSAGLALIGWYIVRFRLGITLFRQWQWPLFLLFLISLLAFAVIADYFGIAYGWWAYPNYHSPLDWMVQKILEFVIAMLYLFFFLLAGQHLWQRYVNRPAALAASMLTTVLPLAIVTQLINLRAHSWVVLDMPVTDATVASVSVMFTTVGYWMLAIVPYALYGLCDSLRRREATRHDKS